MSKHVCTAFFSRSRVAFDQELVLTSSYSDAVKEEWKTTTSVDGKEIALRALGRTQNPKLLADYLKFLTSEVAAQDIHTGASALSANPKARHTLWRYLQKNFDPIFNKLANSMVIFGKYSTVHKKLH